MRRAIRVLRRGDPARDLGPALDERAEAELVALVGPQLTLASPPSRARVLRSRSPLRTGFATGAVAVLVVALTLVVLVNSPATRGLDLPAQHATSQGSAAGTASASSLIGPRGSRVLTRAQLHDYVLRTFDDAGSTNATAWEEQQWLAIWCMAAAGFLWDPTLERAPHQTPAADGLTPSQQRQWQDTLGGPGSTTPYNWRTDSDWRNAGCIGRAVHATTQQERAR